MASLFVTAGPDKGAMFPVTTDQVVFGRDASCSFQLADSQASRLHFRITTDPAIGPGPVLVDLGSANGTLVNGTRLTAPHPLREGDTITVGTTTLCFASKPPPKGGFYNAPQIPSTTENLKRTFSS